MQEKIGKITLDYEFYPGEDLYSDGDVEDQMLSIVKEHKPSEYRKLVEEAGSWPILYHLSSLRGNIVDWLPIHSRMKVLEIGSGCGAITGTLAQKAGSVTCVDLSKKRSQINAYRNQEYDNVTIHVGNFKDIEPSLPNDFDYVLLIGVFEYAAGYIGGENPYEEFMRILYRHCKFDGHLVIAIENKFGLKYWAGCREDHAGLYFEGLENYPHGGSARTFTRHGLEEIMKKVGVDEYHFYYPYPDYKFMHSIYSDQHLPKPGELSTNMRNFDRERMQLFDETAVFNTILQENEFPLFSNSYMVVTGRKTGVLYSKFSNERAEEYAVRTDLIEKGFDKTRYIRKVKMSQKAEKHLDKMVQICHELEQKYAGSGLVINRCEKQQDGTLLFPFIEGTSLEAYLDQCISKNDVTTFKDLILEYKKLLSYRAEQNYCDYDFIFQNILISKNGWNLIDYEWTYEEVIPMKEIAYRAWYCFGMGSEKRKEFQKDWYFRQFNITKQDEEAFEKREAAYQKQITGGYLALGEIRDRIGNPVISPMAGEKVRVGGEDLRYLVQVYPDQGDGFSEETAFFLPRSYISENELEFTFDLPENCRAVRIDPAMFSCLVNVRDLLVDGTPVKNKMIITNGKKIGERSFFFATEDPGITIRLHKPASSLSAKLDVVRIDKEVAERV